MLRVGKFSLAVFVFSFLTLITVVISQLAPASISYILRKNTDFNNAIHNKTTKVETVNIAAISPHQTITFGNANIGDSKAATNTSPIPNSCPQTHNGTHLNIICTYFDCWSAYFRPPNRVDSNTANFPGVITNTCSFTLYNVKVTFTYETENCGGISSAPTSNYAFASNPIPGYYSFSFTAGDTGYCETCRNGIAVAWPPFNLAVYLQSVIGYDSPSGPNRNAYEELNLDSTNIYMPNSSRYSFPCS